MPRLPDPAVRAALIESAAQILATEGPSRLTLRHLAKSVGTSTMAIYTHFGGMEQLRLEVCTEGFRRLAAHMEAVAQTDDPVADVIALGIAYTENARENPHLYRAMFLDPLPLTAPLDVGVGAPAVAGDGAAGTESAATGAATPDGAGPDGSDSGGSDTGRSNKGGSNTGGSGKGGSGKGGSGKDGSGTDGPGTDESDDALAVLLLESVATFEVLVAATARCVDAERFDADPGADPRALAGELWGATHGLVALELSGLLGRDQSTVLLGSVARHLAVAFGDSPAEFERSAAKAAEG